MTAQELIHALKSATVDEMSHIRGLLKIPDVGYQRDDIKGAGMPRDLGKLWNRSQEDSAGVPVKIRED